MPWPSSRTDPAGPTSGGSTPTGGRSSRSCSGPDVYVLAHEELQRTAVEFLGPSRLGDYTQRLHTWANRYREQGWPPRTPEYLLRGYYRLLQASGDLARMVACAEDTARHDRMLDITGGDTAALAEITGAQDVILAQPDPDLLAMARLAVRADALAERNADIPTVLPAVWVTLGQPIRAEALAGALSNTYMRAAALANMAKAMASTGHLDRARALADRAEALARTIGDSYQQASAMAQVATALAGFGDLDRAEALAWSITDGYPRDSALAELAKAVARVGDLDRAEALAHPIAEPDLWASALAELAKAMAGLGDFDRADALAHAITEPEEASATKARHRAIAEPYQASALAALATAVAGAGDLDQARSLADRAEALARGIADGHPHLEDLVELAKAMAGLGDLALVARALTDQAEALARAISDPDGQSWALLELAEAAAHSGEFDRAEALARAISERHPQASALAAIATAVAGTGDLDRARSLADRAEAVARAIDAQYPPISALVELAKAMASAGDLDQARALADRAEGGHRESCGNSHRGQRRGGSGGDVTSGEHRFYPAARADGASSH